jgi:hypothetical protein
MLRVLGQRTRREVPNPSGYVAAPGLRRRPISRGKPQPPRSVHLAIVLCLELHYTVFMEFRGVRHQEHRSDTQARHPQLQALLLELITPNQQLPQHAQTATGTPCCTVRNSLDAYVRFGPAISATCPEVRNTMRQRPQATRGATGIANTRGCVHRQVQLRMHTSEKERETPGGVG